MVRNISVLQSRVIQSLDGLSEENLQFLLDMIQRFMKPANEPKITESAIRKIGSLEGQDLIDEDYDIDECNDEIAEMFGVQDR